MSNAASPATDVFVRNHSKPFWKAYYRPFAKQSVQDRKYQKKKADVEKFVKKQGKIDHAVILNSVDVDYDTLMKILSELRNEGRIS
jgi:biopolymer transport protein ExbD